MSDIEIYIGGSGRHTYVGANVIKTTSYHILPETASLSGVGIGAVGFEEALQKSIENDPIVAEARDILTRVIVLLNTNGYELEYQIYPQEDNRPL